MPNNLEWLEDWYQRQCDGDWEHTQGIRLESLRRRGWRLTISLEGTSAQNIVPNRLNFGTSGDEWIDCSISEARFEGAGDPRRLEQIIGVFRKWVEDPQEQVLAPRADFPDAAADTMEEWPKPTRS